jgi:TetR/AcrR family transcriptional regulator
VDLRTIEGSPTADTNFERWFKVLSASTGGTVSGALEDQVRSPRVRARHERRRAEILRAALRSFRERGYHATTLDAIAEQVGVRKTALYHYFPDKQAILLACHRESITDLERIVAEARELREAAGQLRHVVMEHVRVMTDAFGASPLAFEVGALEPDRQADIIGARDRYERALRDIIEHGMRDGTFRPGSAKVAAFTILGALNGIARWYRPDGELDARALGEQFASHLVGGLLAPARTPRRALRPPRATGRHLTPHPGVHP